MANSSDVLLGYTTILMLPFSTQVLNNSFYLLHIPADPDGISTRARLPLQKYLKVPKWQPSLNPET